MTPPTFQELLTSQEARQNADWFHPRVGNGTFWMNRYGEIFALNPDLDIVRQAIWQGYLQEAAPPEPRVFSQVAYYNVYDHIGLVLNAHQTRQIADENIVGMMGKRIACVRVEITAIEGQFDD